MEKLKLTDEQILFLKSMSNVDISDNDVRYHIPFLFKELGNNEFEIYKFENLPEHLKDNSSSIRNEIKIQFKDEKL